MIGTTLELEQERSHPDPVVISLLGKLSEMEYKRIGMLVVTAALMSRSRGVLIQASATQETWVVTVRQPGGEEFVSRAKEALSWALDRALEWLRKPLREGKD